LIGVALGGVILTGVDLMGVRSEAIATGIMVMATKVQMRCSANVSWR